MSQLYTDAGVNLSAGNSMSQLAAERSRESWKNSSFVRVTDHSKGNFRGPKTFRPINVPDGWELLVTSDGIGTKKDIIAEAFTYEQMAIDMGAMLAGDQTRTGAMPL